MDRVVRSVADLARLIELGDRDGYAIVAATQPFDLPDAFGRAMAQIVAVFAELEAAMISERVQAAMRHLRTSGRWSGGHVPFGYMPEALDGGGYRLVPCRMSRRQFVASQSVPFAGESWYSLATWPNKEGTLSPRDWQLIRQDKPSKGRKWTANTLSRIMQSPVLVGYQMHDGLPVHGKDGQKLPPQFPAILDEETHRAVRALAPQATRPKAGAT